MIKDEKYSWENFLDRALEERKEMRTKVDYYERIIKEHIAVFESVERNPAIVPAYIHKEILRLLKQLKG